MRTSRKLEALRKALFAALSEPDALANPGQATLVAMRVIKAPGVRLDEMSTGYNKRRKMRTTIVMVLIAVGVSFASAQIPVTATADAAAVKFQGAWSPQTLQEQTIDVANFGATKDNSITVAAYELMPLGSYGVAVGMQPNICGILSKTNFACTDLTVSVQGFGGTTVLPVGSVATYGVLGSFAYNLSTNTSATGGFAGGGAIGGKPFILVSAGLQYAFNPAANPSALVQKMLRRRAAATAMYRRTQ